MVSLGPARYSLLWRHAVSNTGVRHARIHPQHKHTAAMQAASAHSLRRADAHTVKPTRMHCCATNNIVDTSSTLANEIHCQIQSATLHVLALQAQRTARATHVDPCVRARGLQSALRNHEAHPSRPYGDHCCRAQRKAANGGAHVHAVVACASPAAQSRRPRQQRDSVCAPVPAQRSAASGARTASREAALPNEVRAPGCVAA